MTRMNDIANGFFLMLIGLAAIYGAMCFVLDAAVREQDFNDGIRAARCERMSPQDRAYMKGYCHDL